MPIQIESVPVAERAVAIRFLLGDADSPGPIGPHEQDPRWDAPQHDEGLFWACQDGQVLAVAWALPVPGGRTLQVTLPRCIAGVPPDLESRMLRRLCDHLDQNRLACLAQIVLDAEALGAAQVASQIGFRHAASLVWLACDPRVPSKLGPLQLDRYGPADRPQLLEILAATFQSSLDCPILTSLLEPADFLAAFEAHCPVEHRDWYFVAEQGQRVGCLLLRGLSAGDPVELLYWGIVPEARGRRIGDRLLELGQGLVGRRGKLLVACVDQANQPAVAALERTGFGVCGRQQLYIRPLGNRRLPAPAP